MKNITTCQIEEKAGQLGFTGFGICPAEKLTTAHDEFKASINSGFHAQMDYLANDTEKRFDPSRLLPDCKSVIVCLYHYHFDFKYNSRYKIARFALLQDYHEWMKEKLRQLTAFMQPHYPEASFKIAVDTAPIAEKRWAVQAGLGTIGKNALFRSDKGSYCYIGIILTDAVLDSTVPLENITPCGSCTKCMDACPTQAIAAPHQVDVNLCVSYNTIEKKEVSDNFQNPTDWIFGCDICQEVCPHNHISSNHADVHNHFSLFLHLDNEAFENMDEVRFKECFKGSTLIRRKFAPIKNEVERVKQLHKEKGDEKRDDE